MLIVMMFTSIFFFCIRSIKFKTETSLLNGSSCHYLIVFEKFLVLLFTCSTSYYCDAIEMRKINILSTIITDSSNFSSKFCRTQVTSLFYFICMNNHTKIFYHSQRNLIPRNRRASLPFDISRDS